MSFKAMESLSELLGTAASFGLPVLTVEALHFGVVGLLRKSKDSQDQ